MMTKITELLGKRLLITDGAMGTRLLEMGLLPGEPSDTWNLTHPERIGAIHKSYLDAGADIIKTNTFVTNRHNHPGVGEVERLARAGAEIARAVVDEAGHGYVAFDVGPTGLLMEPLGELTFEDAVGMYSEAIRAGADACDLIIFETFTDIYELKAAIIAAKECTYLPIFATVTMDSKRRLMTGADIDTVVTMLEGLGVCALGFNCGVGPDTMEELMPELSASTSLPIIINPNAGLPEIDADGRSHYNVSPDEFADTLLRIVRAGASVVGGCCGTTPDYIREVSDRCRSVPFSPPKKKNFTRACSASETIVFGNEPLIIGERINPTGKPRLREALRAGDFEYLVNMAYRERDAGAHALDVNCGLPDIDEPAALARAVHDIQAAVPTPLEIDTSDKTAMEAAARIYRGKPIINSVNGKREVMDAIFPIVKKYGGVVVCLTIDEDGIPDTAAGRVGIAKRIIEEAGKYGIEKKDLIIDTLTMAVSTVPDSAEVTIEALEICRRELGVNTVLGVSNISFGLPDRETVNAAFYTLAMKRGLSAAIINPESSVMMGAYRAYLLLAGYDRCGVEYSKLRAGIITTTENAAAVKKSDVSEKGVGNLAGAIAAGRANDALRLTKELALTKKPLDIIGEDIIPGLTALCREYDENKIFLPQLIAGTDAATAAFSELKSHIGASDIKSHGIIVLATVHGDIHDIGKNIVHAVLENYGYEIHDLGRDVPVDTIVGEVLRTKAKLLGLSALMTTTVPAMRDTIAAVKEKAPFCKIAVGGAVLTQEIADDIGADYYTAEATGMVAVAREALGE
ncbi:MAG: homocysteine S-methyltransferase family protein [Firmicutes bacterium]|nr:homocysteine S-methyltransferase family protein [Bacillota bacterium]